MQMKGQDPVGRSIICSSANILRLTALLAMTTLSASEPSLNTTAKVSFRTMTKALLFMHPVIRHMCRESEKSNSYHYVDRTNFASPAVAAVLAHCIGFKVIKNHALKAIGRLKLNWHQGILDEAIPNIFAHPRLQHPLKGPNCPYNGPGLCDQSVERFLDGRVDSKHLM